MKKKRFSVIIKENNIVLLDNNGTNLSEALYSNLNSLQKTKFISYSLWSLFFLSIGLYMLKDINMYTNAYQDLLIKMSIGFGGLSILVSFYRILTKEVIEKTENKINLAHSMLEDEIFEAQLRLKQQQVELQKVNSEYSFFKKESESLKEING